MSIPAIPLVTTPIRLPNERLWHLHRKCAAGNATAAELDELDRMSAALEAGQDLHRIYGSEE